MMTWFVNSPLALDLNLAGVMVWSIETDDFNGESSRAFSTIYLLRNLIRTSIVTYLWGHRSIANKYWIFVGNCKKGHFPLLAALNEGLAEKVQDDGGKCNPDDYSLATQPNPEVTTDTDIPPILDVPKILLEENDYTIDDQDEPCDCKCNAGITWKSSIFTIVLFFFILHRRSKATT